MSLIKKSPHFQHVFNKTQFNFVDFLPRTGVEPFLNNNLKLLLANLSIKNENNCKAVILKKNEIFIFSIFMYNEGKILHTHAEISTKLSRQWSRHWQNGLTENLITDLVRQHYLWQKKRNLFLSS